MTTKYSDYSIVDAEEISLNEFLDSLVYDIKSGHIQRCSIDTTKPGVVTIDLFYTNGDVVYHRSIPRSKS